MFELHSILKQDTYSLGHFDICQLLLMNDSNYPWFILVPQANSIQEIFQLPEVDQIQVLKESSRLGKIICEVFNADKLNVAALGNVCPQLHIHHIVRYRNDPAWPAPVWGKIPAKPYSGNGKAVIIEKLKSRLHDNFHWE